MPQQKPQNKEKEDWKPDFDHILGFHKGVLLIGGKAAAGEVVQSLKSEASMLKMTELIPLLFNTIGNEAARYAIEEAKVGETAEVRSTKLAFAQALFAWNKHVRDTLVGLGKL